MTIAANMVLHGLRIAGREFPLFFDLFCYALQGSCDLPRKS